MIQQLSKVYRFNAGLMLASYESGSRDWLASDYSFLAEQMTLATPDDAARLHELLAPVIEKIRADLERIFFDKTLPDSQLERAAAALAGLARRRPFTDLLLPSTPAQWRILWPTFVEMQESKRKLLVELLSAHPAGDLSPIGRIDLGVRRAGAAIAAIRLGRHADILPIFQVRDDPEAMTQFIHGCRDRGVTATDILECLDIATNREDPPPAAGETGWVDYTRFALILALGGYPLDEIPANERDSLLKELENWYANDPSSAIHGAAGWLLRLWGQNDVVQRVDQKPLMYSPDREWFTLEIRRASRLITPNESKPSSQPVSSSLYLTFVVFPAAVYEIGCGPGEIDLYDSNDVTTKYRVEIKRPFAILDREITFDELGAVGDFDKEYFEDANDIVHKRKYDPSTAAVIVPWYDCVKFCRALTVCFGLNDVDQAYPDADTMADQEFNSEKVANAQEDWPITLDRTGFRLTTETEWEVACRSGASTLYSFGSDPELLDRYAWYGGNAEPRPLLPKLLRPNLRGLFDMHGNVHEWCSDWFGTIDQTQLPQTDIAGPMTGHYRVFRGGSTNFFSAIGCRSGNRNRQSPGTGGGFLGMRIALTLPRPSD